jgi:hypothetical protein
MTGCKVALSPMFGYVYVNMVVGNVTDFYLFIMNSLQIRAP